jgi:hypothetical protein
MPVGSWWVSSLAGDNGPPRMLHSAPRMLFPLLVLDNGREVARGDSNVIPDATQGALLRDAAGAVA